MAINFPSTPTNNQTHSENGIDYKYDASVGAWVVVPVTIPSIPGTTDGQVIFNSNMSSNGSNGLTFSKTANTLYANTVNVTGYLYGNGAFLTGVVSDFSPAYNTANAAFDKANSANVLAYNTGIGANGYTDSATISANNYAGVMANSANAYAASLTPDLSPAFNKANDAYTQANAANVLAYDTGIGANNYAGAMANSSNIFTGLVYTSVNSAFGVANAAFNFANTSSANSFSTINVSSQGNVTASLSNDVLKLVSGGGINITTNTSAKSITISQATTIDYGLIDGAVTAENDYGSIA